MKLAIVIVLLFAMTANAQKSNRGADSAKTLIAPTQLTYADTVRALHNLFKSRRNTGGWLAGGSAAVTAITGLGTLAGGRGNDPYFSPDAAGATLLIGIALAPVWVPGSISLLRFNKKMETKEIENYEKTRKLPAYLQRKLAKRLFATNYRVKKKS